MDGYRMFGFEGCVRIEKIKSKAARAEYQKGQKKEGMAIKALTFLVEMN